MQVANTVAVMNKLANPKYRADFSVGDFGLVKRAVSDVSPNSIFFSLLGSD